MDNAIENRAIALSGLLQSVLLVQQLAASGQRDAESFAVSIHSVLILNPETYAAVYGGIQGIRSGLKALRKLLGTREERNDPRLMESIRYALSLIQLERQLHSRKSLQARLKDGIDGIVALDLPRDEPESAAERMGALYLDTLSHLSPRVMVRGDQARLSNPRTAAHIRALLLAGIRSAMLWRQAQGSRWRLIWERQALAQTCQRLLANA